MALDSQNPAIMALLVERVEELTKKVDALNSLALLVNTHDSRIQQLTKDNSDNHKGIRELAAYTSQTKGGNKVLYAVIMIFSGIMTGIGGTAIALFFKDSNTISALSQQVDDLKSDVNLLLGARK